MSEVKTYSKEYLEFMAGVPKIKASEFTEIVDSSMLKLSFLYADQYKANPTNFITCFIKYPSIRTACVFIALAYKRSGAFAECLETGKDFSGYSEKQPIADKWKRVLAEILLILYSIING